MSYLLNDPNVRASIHVYIDNWQNIQHVLTPEDQKRELRRRNTNIAHRLAMRGIHTYIPVVGARVNPERQQTFYVYGDRRRGCPLVKTVHSPGFYFQQRVIVKPVVGVEYVNPIALYERLREERSGTHLEILGDTELRPHSDIRSGKMVDDFTPDSKPQEPKSNTQLQKLMDHCDVLWNAIVYSVESYKPHMRAVFDHFTGVLSAYNIEVCVPAIGSDFDPQNHYGTSTQAGGIPGTIHSVMTPGYRHGGKIIKHPKVVVNTGDA